MIGRLLLLVDYELFYLYVRQKKNILYVLVQAANQKHLTHIKVYSNNWQWTNKVAACRVPLIHDQKTASIGEL